MKLYCGREEKSDVGAFCGYRDCPELDKCLDDLEKTLFTTLNKKECDRDLKSKNDKGQKKQ